MAFELGVHSFGNAPRTPDDGHGPTAQAIRDVLEAVRLAEEVGLDFFGFGEHHTRAMPLSSPTSLVTAAAASTEKIRLGTTVTVLSTDEPIRVFQQLATAAAIAPGRIEAVAGRGSSAITFRSSTSTSATTTCSTAPSSIAPRAQPAGARHVERATPPPAARRRPHRAPSRATASDLARQGRAAPARSCAPRSSAVAVHGFVGEDNRRAKADYLDFEIGMMREDMSEIGRPGGGPPGRPRPRSSDSAPRSSPAIRAELDRRV